MKVIRVKVKTIILTIFIFFITIPYVFYFIGMVGYSYMNTQQKNMGIYTVGFLKIYEKWPTIKFNEGKNYFMIAMSNYNYMLEKAETSYSGTARYIYGKQGNMEQAEIARKYFEKGIALGEDDGSYINNLNGLINLEMILGNTIKAKDLIDNAINSNDEDVVIMGKVNEMAYEAKGGHYDKALDLAENYKDEYDFFNGYIDVINYLKGDLDKIKVNDIYNTYTNEQSDLSTMLKNNKARKDFSYRNFINFYSKVDKSPEFNTNNIDFVEVSGKILVKGKPLANAEVRLNSDGMFRDYTEKNSLNLREQDYEFYQVTYTNENGEFVFKNAYPNIKYDIRAIVPSAINDNTSSKNYGGFILKEGEKIKIDFEIEEAIKITDVKTDYTKDQIIIKYTEVPGANNYGVMIVANGYGSGNNNLSSGNEIRIPLTKGSLQCHNIMGYNENNTPTPENILGLIKEDEAYIQVIAFDKEGKEISRSFKYDKINFKKKQLNQGERLIDNGKIDEGYKWLKDALEKDPNNKEYMYPLMRIAFEKGDKGFGNELINRLEEINGTGYDKAVGEGYNSYLEYKDAGSN